MYSIFYLLCSQHSRICMLLIKCIQSLPPITIAVHYSHSLDINDKLPPSIAMSQCTISYLQVTRTDKNIAASLKIEVTALSSRSESHSCDNIQDREAKESVLKPNSCPTKLCHCTQDLPAHSGQLSRLCPEASLAFPSFHKQFPSSMCGDEKQALFKSFA
jgi:hypothetical protein